MTDPATEYTERVLGGEIPAGRLVRLACERHQRDLRRDDLFWDADAVERVVEFYSSMLRVSDGRPFELSPHQVFYVGSLYGWKHPGTGHLRYRVAYIEISRGDGKTPVAGGMCLKALCFEGVREAQIYAAGAVRDQALLLLRDAAAMAEESPEIAKLVKVTGRFPNVWCLSYLPMLATFKAISSENKKAGARTYLAVVDEYHEHDTPYVYEILRTATKGKPNARIVLITNSGTDRTSPCWHEHEYTRKVLEGTIQDDARYGYITGLDPCAKHREEGRDFPVEGCPECDDWRDESVWPKACPNIGVTTTLDNLRELVVEAEGKPTMRNSVKRLYFNVWTEQLETWIPIESWNACIQEFSPESLRGRRCIAGADLAYSDDTCALILLFPPTEDGEPYKWLEWYWVPREMVATREHEHRVPYATWIEDGYLEATPGNVTDYGHIRHKVAELSEVYEIERIPMDRSGAVQLSTELVEDGFQAELFPQGPSKFSPAMREMERLVKGRGIAHRGHPVTVWQLGNVAVYESRTGDTKPDKRSSRGKIDGPVALLMALAIATETPDWSPNDAGLVLV